MNYLGLNRARWVLRPRAGIIRNSTQEDFSQITLNVHSMYNLHINDQKEKLPFKIHFISI